MDNEKLIEIAKKARENAYAPYSNFKVGAALLTKTGNVYKGCNVENASYGLTVCAERVAISNAISSGEKEFMKIAIAGGFNEEYIEKVGEEVEKNIDEEDMYKTKKNEKEKIKEIAKRDIQEIEDVLIPCGACMQVMSEFNPNLELILSDSKGKIIIKNLKEVFPKPFQL
ncbi:MAG: cytidine deaminase [Actinomycetia bacterium]|nr:cytidine deaminase [Actinomycetes bacterium]